MKTECLTNVAEVSTVKKKTYIDVIRNTLNEWSRLKMHSIRRDNNNDFIYF